MGSWRYVAAAFLGVLFFLGFSDTAFAGGFGGGLFANTHEGDLSAVSENIITSVEDMPGLLTAISYMVAILFGAQGILKLKDHVENPAQTPLKIALARFAIGGALLSTPIVYEAVKMAFDGGQQVTFESEEFDLNNFHSGLAGIVGGITGGIANGDFNYLLASIVSSVRSVPGLITGLAYLLGILFGVLGLIRVKDHIENPEQNPLKDGVIRMLTAGALFALPTLWDAMQTTIRGDGSFDVGGALDFMEDMSDIAGSAETCDPLGGLGGLFGGGSSDTLGTTMCSVVSHTAAFQAFLTAISYLFGLVLGVWAVLKVQDHVMNPQQTPIWDGISRFLAAGAFFSLPFMAAVLENTISPTSLTQYGASLLNILNGITSIFNGIFGGGGGSGSTGCNGLDGAVSCFVTDIFAPMSLVVKVFAVFAGLVLIMIGISRLIKSSQDGARAPGGIGTMMTFLTGGALLSYNSILSAFSVSFFNDSDSQLNYAAALQYTQGMNPDEIAHAQLVIQAILRFMVLVGIISFVRGMFIIRNVAEGNGQASLMAGVTHMVGGALAVNLGPLMNAVQNTLGIASYGIQFS